jgi:thiol-disulfide isomerase/thioredoxin
MKRVLHILLLLSMSSCIKEKQKGADLGVSDLIPDFTVTMNDGTQVTGALLREGVSVIAFFTTQCGDCRETLPHIQQLYDEYALKGVRFALISREDTEENILSFWKDNGFTMPFSAQSDRRIYELFARSRVPRVYICRDGVIKYIFSDKPSIPTYELLSASLEEVL